MHWLNLSIIFFIFFKLNYYRKYFVETLFTDISQGEQSQSARHINFPCFHFGIFSFDSFACLQQHSSSDKMHHLISIRPKQTSVGIRMRCFCSPLCRICNRRNNLPFRNMLCLLPAEQAG